MKLQTITKIAGEQQKITQKSLINKEYSSTASQREVSEREIDESNTRVRHKKHTRVSRDEEGEQKKMSPKKAMKQEENKRNRSIFQVFFKYTLQRKYLALMVFVMSIGYGVSVTLLPLQIGVVLDFITRSQESQPVEGTLADQIIKLGTIIGVAYLLANLRFFSTRFLEQFLVIDMRKDVFKKFIHFDMHFYQQYKTGQLVLRLTSDINQVKSAVSNNLAYLFRSLIVTFFTLIILFTISWILALLIIAALPIYYFLTFHYSRQSKILNRQYQNVMGIMSANLSQKIGGIVLVKAYANEEREVEKHQQINLKLMSIAIKKIILNTLYQTVIETLPYLSIMLVLYMGGILILQAKNSFTLGQLTSFIMYCSTIATNTSAISSSYTAINNGIYSVQNLFDMLQYNPKFKEYQGKKINIQGHIQCKNVTFQYPLASNPVFQSLSLNIHRGEYIAFVGESGSGKSTIIKLIEKFYESNLGEIMFDGQCSKELNISHIRKQIGFVDQGATLFSGTVQQNITYGLQSYSSQELQRAAGASGCLQFLSDPLQFPKGFQTQVGQKGSSLSGGQRQRISIARALIRKPKIIIFDEATSALDANSQTIVQKSIENIARSTQSATVIVIAHRLSTIINTHRIYVMKSGKIVQMGAHQQLLQDRKGYYFQLIEKQLSQQQIAVQFQQK